MNNNFIASVKIGEEWQQVFAIFPFSMGKLLDERLDEAKLTFFSDTEYYLSSTEFKVLFISTGHEYNFILANDDSSEYPAGSGRYKHEAYLIERTKLLDGVLCSSITFTNLLPSNYELLSGNEIYAGNIKKSYDGTSWISVGFDSIFSSPIPMVLNVRQSYTLPSSQEVAAALAAWLNTQQDVYTYSPIEKIPINPALDFIYTQATYSGDTEKWASALEITPSSTGERSIAVTYQCCLTGEIGPQSDVAFKFTAYITALPKIKPLSKYTITDCVLRALELAEPLREGENPRFTFDGISYDNGVATSPIPGSQAEKYSKIYAPEFTLTQSTLREQLKAIGKKIHAEPWLDADNVVHFLEYGNSVESANVNKNTTYISKTLKTDINQYCTEVRSNVQNLVSSLSYAKGTITEPGIGLYRSLRSETKYARINEETGVIETDLPIFSIPKTPGAVMCGLINRGLYPGWELGPVDITPYIYEATEYGANLSSFGGGYPYAKEYAIYYTIGERNLKGLFYKVQDAVSTAAYSRFAISNILALALGLDANDVDEKIANTTARLAFQVTYQPISSAFISHGKQYYTPDLTRYVQIYNQSENLIESEYYGQNIKGVAARLGNVEQERTYIFSDLYDLPNVGEVIEIGTKMFSISAVSCEVLPRYVKCTLGLSLDFNRISEYVGVNSVKRMYEVSERQTQQRQVLIKESVVINSVENKNSDTDRIFRTTARFTSALSDETGVKDTPVKYALFKAYKKNGAEINGNSFVLPCIGRAFGNALHFSFTLEDNYSAGSISTYEAEDDVSGYFQGETPYADEYGRGYWASVGLINSADGVGNLYSDPFGLPASETLSNINYAATTGNKHHRLRKDGREIISYNIEAEFKTEDPDLIIGSGLAEYCDLINGDRIGNVVYLTNTPPDKLEQYYVPKSGDLKSGGVVRTGAAVGVSINVDAYNDYKYFVVCTPINSSTEDVADEDGTVVSQPRITGGLIFLAGSLSYNFSGSGDQFRRTFYFRTMRN